MKWIKLVVILIVLAIITLSSLFYINILLVEKYSFVVGIDKVVSMAIEDRIAEITTVKDFLKINIILSIALFISIFFVKDAKRESP